MSISRLSPLSPPFRAVIFDLDGLMVNTEHLVFKAYQQLLEPHGLSLSEADARAMLGLDIEDTARYVIDKTGYPGSLADLTETHYRRWLQVIDGELEPAPGLVPLIDYLERSGYKLAVASNSPLEYINHILRAIRLSSHFGVVVGRDQVARGKPGPDLYQMAAHWLGISPSQCLALEDSPVGMQSALAAGTTCVVISPEAFTEPQFAAAHARYPSLIELLDDIDAIFVR